MGIVVWWSVSRLVPFVVIQSPCQQINPSVHRVKQYKIKMKKLLLHNMYACLAWSSAVNLSTCRVIIFPMGTEYICDPVGTGVPMQGLLLPALLTFVFVIVSWYLLMSSLVGMLSLIDRQDQCKYLFIVIS